MELPAIVTNGSTVVDESTVDYMGHYRGYPVAFDAKECGDLRFNIKTNCKPHQVQFLDYFKMCSKTQPIVVSGFVLNFYKDDPDYLYFLDIDVVTEAIKNGCKSFLMSDLTLKIRMDENFYEELIKQISNKIPRAV